MGYDRLNDLLALTQHTLRQHTIDSCRRRFGVIESGDERFIHIPAPAEGIGGAMPEAREIPALVLFDANVLKVARKETRRRRE